MGGYGTPANRVGKGRVGDRRPNLLGQQLFYFRRHWLMLSGQAIYGATQCETVSPNMNSTGRPLLPKGPPQPRKQNLVAPCPAKLLSNFRGFFSSIPPCVQELLSLKMEPHYAYFLENCRIIL